MTRPFTKEMWAKDSKSLRQNAFLLYFLDNKNINKSHKLLLIITGRLMFKFVNLFFFHFIFTIKYFTCQLTI